MNTPILPRIGEIACLAALLCPGGAATAEPSRVALKVEVEGKVDITGRDSKTQTRTLNLDLVHSGKESIPSATIQWTLYGHDMKDRDLVAIASGSCVKDLPAGKTTRVSGKDVRISSVREHSVAVRKGQGRHARTSYRKVPASGREYYGYGVRVLVDGKVLAEEYSQASIAKLAKGE